MNNNSKSLDLDNPIDAKFFLRSVKIAGKKIEFVTLATGEDLSIEAMTNKQIVTYAKDIYFDFCGGIEGKDGTIELDEPATLQ